MPRQDRPPNAPNAPHSLSFLTRLDPGIAAYCALFVNGFFFLFTYRLTVLYVLHNSIERNRI